MTNDELLIAVKKSMGIFHNFQDETLKIYIEEVKNYMKASGVKNSVINSSMSIGLITRGVLDLWDYGNGSAKLSQYFKDRLIQLATEPETYE